MTKLWRILGLVMVIFGFWAAPARGQIVVLGKWAEDKALPAFFSQNGNANTIAAGLNANATTPLANAILDSKLSGKIYLGIFDGTNNASQRFVLRTWDTNMVSVGSGGLQVFEFNLNTNLPANTNVVSRVGFPEILQYKTLDKFFVSSNGVAQTGVPVAQGSSALPARVVLGLTQTNRIYIQKDWAWTTPTNYIEIQYGVTTAVQ
jgi:hypothetical protein